MLTQGSKSLSNDSKVYITNYSGFDMSALIEYVGINVQGDGLVIICPSTVSPKMIKEDSNRIHNILENFRPGIDWLMISGRGFANFVIGSICNECFYHETIDLLIFNPSNSRYHSVEWEVCK